MIKMPKILQQVIQSDAYKNKTNPDHIATINRADELLQRFYPGKMQADATGKFVAPKYDMTEMEFFYARNALNDELDEKIKLVKTELSKLIKDESKHPDINEYIYLSETIVVKIQSPNNVIYTNNLEIFDIDTNALFSALEKQQKTPEDEEDNDDDEDDEMVTVWVAGGGCDACADMDGAIIESGDAVCPHPNCGCGEETMTMEEYLEIYGEPDPNKQAKLEELKKQRAEYDQKYGTDLKAEKQARDETLTDEFKNDIKDHEGFRNTPYVDSEGNITVGIGNNVNAEKDFVSLNITNTKTGEILSNTEKSELHSQMSAEIKDKTFDSIDYNHLQVSKQDIDSKFDTQMKTAYNEVSSKFENFNSLPVSVRQALTDMQFNMGTPKFSADKWPNLFNAINNHEWGDAAKHSKRPQVQQSRNDWTSEHFLMAM